MAYSHYDVAHRWATGIGERCKGGNMFFEGNYIFSYGYHFVIAVKYNGKVLFNDDTYSNSTSKHQSITRGACRQYDLIHCAHLSYRDTIGDKAFIKSNLDSWRGQIEWVVENKLGKARKPEKYYAEILEIVRLAEEFCEFFKVKLPKEFISYKADTPDRKVWMEKVLADMKKRAEAAARKRAKAEKESAEKFMKFESNYFNGNYQIVRLRTDKNRFETSLGVQIPFEIGREFYEKLRDGLLHVGDQVLYYTIRALGNEIKIGCHTFKRSYLLEYGKKVFA